MDIVALLGSFGTSFLNWVLAPIFVITVVVFVHEFGHFQVARWCGVKVSTFSIGFGPRIFGFTDKLGTQWQFSWIPLGGYVKFIDDENAASVPDTEKLKTMTPEERDGTFQGKPLWQRVAVVAAGPIANFILTLTIFAVLFGLLGQNLRIARIDGLTPGSVGEKAGFKAGDVVLSIDGRSIDGMVELDTIVRSNANENLSFVVSRAERPVRITAAPRRVDLETTLGNKIPAGEMGFESFSRAYLKAVSPGGAAAAAGLQGGDTIIELDGKPVASFKALLAVLKVSGGKTLSVVVERNGQKISTTMTPKAGERKSKDGAVVKHGIIGVTISAPPEDFTRKHYGPLEAMWKGTVDTYEFLTSTLANLFKIVDGRESVKQLGGPITIIQIASQVAAVGFDKLLWFTAVISASIGLLNLFPIPLLDGGHLMYYAAEAVRGRPLSARTQEIGFMIGGAMVASLMVLVFYNDLARISGPLYKMLFGA